MPPYDEATLVELRERMPEYLETVCGITDLRRPFRCLVPAHEDRNPSMHYNSLTHRVHCFSCNADGDVFDVAEWVEGATSFPAKVEAVSKAVGYFLPSSIMTNKKPPSNKPTTARKPIKIGYDRPKPLADINLFDQIQQSILALSENSQAQAARDHLYSRGFTDEEIAAAHIGWVQQPSELFPDMKAPLCNDGYIALFFTALTENVPVGEEVFSYPYHVEAVPYAVFRKPEKGAQPKELKPPKLVAPIWGEHLLTGAYRTNDEVYVVEGIFDAMSLTALLGAQACAVCGSSGIRRLLQIMAHTPEDKRPRLILAFDADEAGAKYTEDTKKGLKELGIPYTTVKPYPCGYKDANEWLMRERGCHD